MNGRGLALLLLGISLCVAGCHSSSDSDHSASGPIPSKGQPVAPPASDPSTVISGLQEGQVKAIQACLQRAWAEDQKFWSTLGSAHLMRCLNLSVSVRNSDLTPQFEVDFQKLYRRLQIQEPIQ